jgi:plastocyanin
MSDERGPLVEERPEPALEEEPAEEARRGLPPIAYPLLSILFAGALVWSFSRILLAVGKDQAVAIATLMALNILVGAALIAYGSRVRRRPAAFPFLVLAGAALIAVGVVANLAFGDKGPEKEEAGGAPKAETVNVTAQGTKFLETSLKLTAGAPITIVFDNKDAQIQHNVVIFEGKDATGEPVFDGEIITGPKVVRYAVTPLAPGAYFFHCKVHPTQMTGTIDVAPPAGAAPPGGPPAVTAEGTAFNPTKVTIAPVGGNVEIHFVNKDALPHNIVVFDGADATAPQLFRGEVVMGPATKDYTFKAPPPGTYFFHCEIHPTQMQGTITIS